MGKNSESGAANPDESTGAANPDEADQGATPSGNTASVGGAEGERQTESSVPGADTTASAADLAADHIAGYEGFDPAIHAVGEDGKPRFTKGGAFALKRGRKASAAGYALPPKNAPAGVDAGERVGPSATQPPRLSVEEAARQSANLVFNLGVMVFGEPLGEPKDKAEADGMKIAFKNYYDSRGVPDMPPEIGLIMAVGLYALPRLRHESMREKLARWGDGFKRLFKRG